MEINFFSSVGHLEPRCKHCDAKVVYGETTRWDDELNTQVCIKCNNPLEIKEEEQELEFESCTL